MTTYSQTPTPADTRSRTQRGLRLVLSLCLGLAVSLWLWPGSKAKPMPLTPHKGTPTLLEQVGSQADSPSTPAVEIKMPEPPPEHRGTLPASAIEKERKAYRRAIAGIKTSWIPSLVRREPDPATLPTRRLFRMCKPPWLATTRDLIWTYTVEEQRLELAKSETRLMALQQDRYWTVLEPDFDRVLRRRYGDSHYLSWIGRYRNERGEKLVLVLCFNKDATPALVLASKRARKAERALWAKVCSAFNDLPDDHRAALLADYRDVLSVCGPDKKATRAQIEWAEDYDVFFRRPPFVKMDFKESKLSLVAPGPTKGTHPGR